MISQKYRLIKEGDIVEYALFNTSNPIQKFVKRKIILHLNREDMSNTKLFNSEHINFYKHFFLVDNGKKNLPIAFEWINSIEID